LVHSDRRPPFSKEAAASSPPIGRTSGASTINSAGPICSTPGSSARPRWTHGPTRFGVMAARSGATNGPHLRPPREPRGRRNRSTTWPDLPQPRHHPCQEGAPPARPRPALAEREALANPHDNRGSRILEVEGQQNRDDGRLVPPEEHGSITAQASIALAPRSHPSDRGDVRAIVYLTEQRLSPILYLKDIADVASNCPFPSLLSR